MTKKDWQTRLERVLWIGADSIARVFEPLWLKVYEKKYDDEPNFPPIFIIGAPRSGTTLIYQAFIYYFDIAYMTNLMAELYHAPLLATAFSKFTVSKNEFHSLYGKTSGLWGPHEGGQFWYRWFPRAPHVYVGPNEMAQSVKASLAHTVHKMSKIAGQPMFFKNTFHTMRIAPLLEIFPDCLFIISHRDPADTAQSILQARIQNFGSPEPWWSVPPQEFSIIKAHPYWDQVVEQVYFCYRQIEADRKRAPDRFFDLSYREFCQQPNASLERMKEKFVELNVNLRKRPGYKLEPFTLRAHQPDKRIRKKVQELWP
ncbi:hypothetical protein GF406_11315 [candidate division KSB1 bacterium]|nr:hypothetical protein [candidate division KSB1 bacterium]